MNLLRLTASLAFAGTLLMAGDIKVENPFVKEVAPNMKNSAAFMTIKNTSDKKISLVTARNDASAITELHTHGKKDGMMVMYKVEKIEVPAHGEALLKPMGLHVMLIGLNKQLKEGDTVNLELVFDNGESVKVAAPVKKLQGAMKPYMDTHK
jgi:periplasmic copper chaperone A